MQVLAGWLASCYLMSGDCQILTIDSNVEEKLILVDTNYSTGILLSFRPTRALHVIIGPTSLVGHMFALS